MSNSMNLYKLSPIKAEQDNDSWEASTYKGEIVISAPSERLARWNAELATVIATEIKPSRGTIFPPWQDATIVSCDLLENSVDHSAPQIIYPEHLQREFAEYDA